jgi:hypothetical protein
LAGWPARFIIIARDAYCLYAIFIWVWEVEYRDEFEGSWDSLDKDEQDSAVIGVEMLQEYGPNLPRPFADTLKRSKHSQMKELRTQHQGRPLRTVFAFDPRRCAILLIGGDKTGDKRFYDR